MKRPFALAALILVVVVGFGIAHLSAVQIGVISAYRLASGFGASFNDGVKAESSGDFASAIKLWAPLAEAGYARAQSKLGPMYEKGRGVPRDYSVAMSLFRKAA